MEEETIDMEIASLGEMQFTLQLGDKSAQPGKRFGPLGGDRKSVGPINEKMAKVSEASSVRLASVKEALMIQATLDRTIL